MRKPSTRVRAGLAGGLAVAPHRALVRVAGQRARQRQAHPHQAPGRPGPGPCPPGRQGRRQRPGTAGRPPRQLDRLNRNAEIAGEAYDGAVYKLGLATKAASTGAAPRGPRPAAVRRRAPRGRRPSPPAAYRSGANFGPADIFLGVGGPGGAVARADAIGAVGAQVERALQTAQSTKIVASVLREQANAALAAQAKAEQAVATAKQRADKAVSTQESKVSGLDAQISALEHRLQLAKLHASHLSTARQKGLAKAARERKLAQERAARVKAARAAALAAAAAAAATLDDRQHAPVVAIGGSSHGTTAGAARAIAYAKRQLGKPYVYAAAGPDAFDCSGLTMRAWEAGGVSLPHWSVAQYEQSQPVSAGNARPGDLVFYSSDPNDYHSIYHVALYLGGGMMIEAPHTGDVVKIISVYPNDLFGYARP